MLVLAIDTALDACSAALIDTDGDRTLASESREIGRGHAEHLLPIIDGVMKKAGVKFNDVDRFAVTVGPGSFTGLRVGLSAARGFGLVTKKPVVGISTLAAFTAPLITQNQAVPVVAAILAAHWPAKAPQPVLVDQRPAPDIEWIARIGAVADPTQASPKPLYLKLPDAQPTANARIAQ